MAEDTPQFTPLQPRARDSRAHRDKYGRIIRADIPKAAEMMFHSILPDNPFGVIRDNSSGPKEADKQYMPVLQFWTWLTELHVSIRDKRPPTESESPLAEERDQITQTKQSESGLRQCDILDKEGDWCGSIILEEDWIEPQDGHMFHFMAISDAKAFTQDECPVWTYYIPKERHESEWDLYYVLLLERNHERGLWERVGLGKSFKIVFPENTWREIKLG